MKNFTELCFEQSDAGAIAQYMDDQMGEGALVKIFGATPLSYGLIAMNQSLLLEYDYELLYPVLIDKKPRTQEEFDNLFTNLFEIEDND